MRRVIRAASAFGVFAILYANRVRLKTFASQMAAVLRRSVLRMSKGPEDVGVSIFAKVPIDRF